MFAQTIKIIKYYFCIQKQDKNYNSANTVRCFLEKLYYFCNFLVKNLQNFIAPKKREIIKIRILQKIS